ncbi:hypothetical protein [Kaistella polysaccharea]|uniref:hypothetical protein n=1 Tax=Kaistella polysaccharea TaxID=2878534 RepID=UPI001CF56F5A|nr:hypothetical protein [Kaistella polysaccharea]
MKKYRFLILLFALIIFIFYDLKISRQTSEFSDKALTNNIKFEGKIKYLKRSDNHAFGIIGVELTKSNIKNFDRKINSNMFPYKIKNGYAEVYATVSVERKTGEIIKVISDSSTIYYNPNYSNEMGSLFLISDPINKRFIENNSEIQ